LWAYEIFFLLAFAGDGRCPPVGKGAVIGRFPIGWFVSLRFTTKECETEENDRDTRAVFESHQEFLGKVVPTLLQLSSTGRSQAYSI
jgi:hypothetical protein